MLGHDHGKRSCSFGLGINDPCTPMELSRENSQKVRVQDLRSSGKEQDPGDATPLFFCSPIT